MEAKITSVYDEGAIERTSLIGAKGFSVLIEVKGKKILFDTGMRGRYLLHNLAFLEVKPEEIDQVVISHGHTSHTGGVDDLLRNREQPLKIYAHSSAVGGKKLFRPKGIFIPEDQAGKADIIDVEDWIEIDDKIHISSPMDIGGGLTEVFMVLHTRKGPVVIAACSHAGLDKVMESVKNKFGVYPKGYIGGVHMSKKDRKKAEEIALLFSEKNCQSLYLNHCTGVNGMMYIRTILGLEGVKDFYVGTTATFEL
ncbi:MAG: MBL fold metallo-hydrolase [Methanomassiliicoccaceae archaeon]|nr:MBL fold metallo-hydrolase [Methanomassiliicoccaceae archaeon]